MSPIDQARNYLTKVDPAISGANGHGTTFHAAAVLVEGFGLSIHEARPLLMEFSARCQPPWSEKEIDHKLADAERKKDPSKVGKMVRRGVRWRMGSSTPPPQPKAAPTPKPAPKAPRYEVSDALELPEPMADGTRQFLRAAFHEGEVVSIAVAEFGADGREQPKDAGITLTREQWLEKLDKHQGNPNKFLSTSDHNGLFVRVNPMTVGGRFDKDVTAFRHVLLEWDELPKVEQWGIIQQSRIPCTAVISSGGKSVHAWVRVDAANKEQYDERVRLLFNHFADYKNDPKNKNPSRFSRLPGCERGHSRQELLALNCGCESWTEWVNECTNTEATEELPAIDNAAALIATEIPTPAELIDGVLHQGCKAIIGGSSKARKTWILIDLALSVASGGQFWKWPTSQGRVLYINFEIPRPFIRGRIQAIAQARGIDDLSALDVWTLRGHAAPLYQLLPIILERITSTGYALIVIDPIYKTLGGRDENSAGDIGELCNEVERLAVKTGAAVVFGAHYSKGNAAAKEAMDRIGGSGVFARDADTIITLTKHKTERAFTVDLILRNHPEQDPFVVSWDYPVMKVNQELHARDLKRTGGREQEYDHQELYDLLPAEGLRSGDWMREARDELGMSKATFNRMRDDLERGRNDKGLKVLKSKINQKWVPVQKST